MPLQTPQLERMVGEDVVDRNGDKIGSIKELWQDDRTGRPAWAEVSTGFFGGKHTLVPIEGARMREGAVWVPFEKAQVKDAPAVDTNDLTRDQERSLHSHYGLPLGETASPPGETMPRQEAAETMPRREGSEAMTRSEEEVVVGKQTHETGRVRLRKYVVTENVETTIPLQHEEVHVEREPITDAARGDLAEPRIGEGEQEVILHAEEPVIGKRTVPKERVRLDKTTEVDEAKISEQARKERIEVEGLDETTGQRRDPQGRPIPADQPQRTTGR